MPVVLLAAGLGLGIQPPGGLADEAELLGVPSTTVTFSGTGCCVAASASAPVGQLLPPGPTTKPLLVRRVDASTPHCAAAADTSMAGRGHPARGTGYEFLIGRSEPPVRCMPKGNGSRHRRVGVTPCTLRTLLQSASSSSARIMAGRFGNALAQKSRLVDGDGDGAIGVDAAQRPRVAQRLDHGGSVSRNPAPQPWVTPPAQNPDRQRP